MRNMSVTWSTNVKNGICGIEFDRRDIRMNKLVVSTLESHIRVFDLRTFNEDTGFAGMEHKVYCLDLYRWMKIRQCGP